MDQSTHEDEQLSTGQVLVIKGKQPWQLSKTCSSGKGREKGLVYAYIKHTDVAITWYHRPSKKEQSVGAVAKHKNDPDHRFWGERE